MLQRRFDLNAYKHGPAPAPHVVGRQGDALKARSFGAQGCDRPLQSRLDAGLDCHLLRVAEETELETLEG
jgi:hypothetical protein